MEVPHLGLPSTDDMDIRNFAVFDSFQGYTTVLSYSGRLLAFASSEHENSPFVIDREAGATVRLARGKGVTKVRSNG